MSGVYIFGNKNKQMAQDEQGRIILGGDRLRARLLLPRQVRGSTSHAIFGDDCPIGARGYILYLNVYGVTGTFSEGQGVGISVQITGGASVSVPANRVINSNPSRSTDAGVHITYAYPTTLEGFNVSENKITKIQTGLLGAYAAVSLSATGDFEVGEGFDCDVFIEWLY